MRQEKLFPPFLLAFPAHPVSISLSNLLLPASFVRSFVRLRSRSEFIFPVSSWRRKTDGRRTVSALPLSSSSSSSSISLGKLHKIRYQRRASKLLPNASISKRAFLLRGKIYILAHLFITFGFIFHFKGRTIWNCISCVVSIRGILQRTNLHLTLSSSLRLFRLPSVFTAVHW